MNIYALFIKLSVTDYKPINQIFTIYYWLVEMNCIHLQCINIDHEE